MGKKKSSKTATRTPGSPVVEQGKKSYTPKRSGGVIDEIFSGKKSKKPEQVKAENPKKFGSEIDEIFSIKEKKKPEQLKAENPKKFGSEIDEIFASKKRKWPEPEKKGEDDAATKSRKTKTRNSQARNKGPKDINRFAEMQSTRPKKKTGDGLVIYTEEELGIGKADAGGAGIFVQSGQ